MDSVLKHENIFSSHASAHVAALSLLKLHSQVQAPNRGSPKSNLGKLESFTKLKQKGVIICLLNVLITIFNNHILYIYIYV